jgi:hypothetical protein
MTLTKSGPMFAAALAALLALPGAALADYGAIAYSPSTGAYGYSNGYGSRGSAERAAMRNCRANGSGCQTALWFQSACGAVAKGPDGWGSGWAASKAGAQSQAIASCRQYSGSCRIVVWSCSG